MNQPTDQHHQPRVGFVSLGCPKALVDSERILTQLKTEGYEIAPDYQGSDLVIVNTCGFIDQAKAESLESIGEALREHGRVIVTGCMGAEPEQITSVHPKVLAVTGPQRYEDVMAAVHQHLPAPKIEHNPYIDLVPPQGIRLTPRHYAYLKISEGCNHRCSFCIIPSMRGDLVSRPAGSIMQEAEQLARAGVQELLVISQDTSAYGVDLKYRMDFWNGTPIKSRLLELCQALGSLGVWVRLHYVYPYPHVDNIIPLMQQGLILPYLDIPFQHASPSILRAMKRPAHAEDTLARIAEWRRICPDIAIRSTFIVGFPGETEADFEGLLDWMSAAQLDRVGCFTYSAVEGAAANELADAVPEEVKVERYERFMEHAQMISEQKLQKRIGQSMQVLIDELDLEAGVAIARSRYDAPEIDGNVFIEDAPVAQLRAGQKVWVRITDADSYDLYAHLQQEP